MAPAFTIATILTLALGIGATTSIFTLVHAVLLKSLPVANPGELYRLGKETRCCYFGGYSQAEEFSLVSYDLYKHFRDNTKGFSELAAFPASSQLFGVRRAGSAEAAESYPGEFVSGNYFAMFGITSLCRTHAHRSRRSTRRSASRGDELSLVAATVWIGSVRHRQRLQSERQAIYGRRHHSAGFLWRRSAHQSARLLSAAGHRTVGARRCRSQQIRHSLAGPDRPHPARCDTRIDRGRDAGRAQAVAALALERDERQRSREIPRPDPVPGSRRRGHHEHARTIRALASDPDDGLRIRAADRLCQRGQSHARPRHGTAAADGVEHGAGGPGVADRESAPHGKPPALVVLVARRVWRSHLPARA